MNYLLQLYACSSHKGGEYAVSWGWLTHVSRSIKRNDHIYVLSLTLTEDEIRNANLNNVTLLKVKGMEKYKFLNYNSLYYFIWQRKAYYLAKSLEINYDVIHVYSLSDFRSPGKWYKFGNAFKIFGPVGGGQICPKTLNEYDDKQGLIREKINEMFKFNLLYKIHVNRYDKVFVCNAETQKYIKSSIFLPDVPLNDDLVNLDIDKQSLDNKRSLDDQFNIIFVGRLINKKGLLFMIDILDNLKEKCNFKCLIYGDGEQKEILRKKVEMKKLDNYIKFMGKIPYSKISDAYKNGDVFILPSLRESGGSVLIEALAHKLPIVALDMSLCHELSKQQCGLFVDCSNSKEKIIQDFVNNLYKLSIDKNLRYKLGQNGYNYVNHNLNWETMMKNVYGEVNNSGD